MKPYRTVLRVVAIVVVSEFLETLFPLGGENLGAAGKLLVDALVLAIVAVPLLLLFVVAPARRELAEKEALARKALEQDMALEVAAGKQEVASRLFSLMNNVPGMVYRGCRTGRWTSSVRRSRR